jgi:gamma-glutamylcyclotransferase (GGCT)/AIG2-like uncharacterized protein YtfP
MHVFTYGTLMFPEVWQAVVGKSFAAVNGKARDYAVYRVKDAVFPGMIAEPGSAVTGVLYLDVDDESVARLDRFEDDFYERQVLWIECDDREKRDAEAYIVPPFNQSMLTSELWDRETFRTSGGLEQFINKFAGFGRVADGD